ncbi:MAG TPA: xanthine dehydrogenase family protein molybdopterin-binding subunit [Ktedonosporobacter sp.]|jgi:carbon-monoxide dehydrogenase large subunit|nr:xanthine dehydrogenase family protein molybdopterin-binding subunit [Ktedonosporobacter sp.]
MSKHIQTAGSERRREDYALITGRGHYVDDIRLPSGQMAAHMVVVRSPYAHAKISGIQLDAARSLPGVIAAFGGAELVSDLPTLDIMPLPGLRRPERRPLAVERVRYVGDPVAVILAESYPIALDARDLVDVTYEVLPTVTDPEAALEPGAPLLYDESNIAFSQEANWGDIQAAFEHADRVVHLRVVNQRLAPASLEPRACLFEFDAASGSHDGSSSHDRIGELRAWVSSQSVFRFRDTLARFLGIDRSLITVQNADVGGAFGAKNNLLGEEIIAALLAIKTGRPVKWVEDRSENLQAQSQGRGQISSVEAAFQNDGRLLGLSIHSVADLGAFLASSTAMVPIRVPSMLCGPYQVQAVESKVVGVFTNKAVTAPYRGAGRPEATYILERTMDRIAHELGLDPAEVRRRNFIPSQAFPHTTITGLLYDSGNYQAAFERVLELADYAGWRAKQRAYRDRAGTRLLGIGLATFIELSGGGAAGANTLHEAATVRIRRDGTILVQSGVSHNGQGHFTAFAQIVASVLHIPASRVEVRLNDTTLPGFSIGTFGSRITQTAGSAVLLAAEAVRSKALRLAAQFWETTPADLDIEDGRIVVAGVPSRMFELGELARMVEEQPELIEREAPNPANGTPIEGLAAWRDFSSPGATYSSGAHLAVVEIDTETGEVQVLTYVAVDDCGRVLNHYLAEAQIHGSLAQGISQALYEEMFYDQDGQLLTGTLLDYTLPLAGQLPRFVTDFIETPSPNNPLGAKGVGEAGCIGAPPAVVNAVLDALAPLGIKTIDMPLRPEKIWRLVHG